MVISVQNYSNAGVKTVRVKDADFLGVKMSDVQKMLGVKNMPDLVKKEIMGILSVNKRCDDFKKYKRSLQEITNDIKDSAKHKYIRNDVVEKIIKNCRGIKRCEDGASRSDK